MRTNTRTRKDTDGTDGRTTYMTDRRTGRQTDRQTSRQAGRQTDRHTHIGSRSAMKRVAPRKKLAPNMRKLARSFEAWRGLHFERGPGLICTWKSTCTQNLRFSLRFFALSPKASGFPCCFLLSTLRPPVFHADFPPPPPEIPKKGWLAMSKQPPQASQPDALLAEAVVPIQGNFCARKWVV